MIEAFRMGNAQTNAVAHRDVIDFPAIARELRARLRFEIRVVGATRRNSIRDFAKLSIEPRRFDTLGRLQVDVA